MHFEPNKRENLSPNWKTAIAQVMQFGLIDQIFDAEVWTPEDVVFHGGTSIHVVWNSPRYSEDLDFMIAVDRSVDIEKVMDRAAANLRKRLLLSLPGSEVMVKKPKAEAGVLGDVLGYHVVWSHPNKKGVVKVKVEFFTVAPENIQNYRREVRRHAPDRMEIASTPEFADFDIGDLRVRSLIPAAHPESIYADKLVAMAKREYLKPRDFFDLWWLDSQMGGAIDLADPERLRAAVRRSAACYRYSDADLLEGLRRFHEHPPEITAEIEDNLRAFLPQTVHRRMTAGDLFRAMYDHAMAETGRLATALEAAPEAAPGVRP